jgi:hypothetical protein
MSSTRLFVRWRPVRAAMVLSVLVLTSQQVASVAAQAAASTRAAGLAPTDAWDTFSVDVTMRRHLVSADGAASAEAPLVRYRWTRSQRQGGWTSTIEIAGLAAPAIRSSRGQAPLSEPTTIVRIEDNEDGTAPRVYNRRGHLVRLPSVDDRRILGEPVPGSIDVPQLPDLTYPDAKRSSSPGRDWVDAFVAAPARKAARRSALQHRFGRTTGRVRHLDRFVTTSADGTMEVLADPASALPIEVNLVRDGALVAQSTLGYSVGANGALVRRSVRSEQVVATGSTNRAVARIELANVRLDRRGAR